MGLLHVLLHDEGVHVWVDAEASSSEEAKMLLENVFNFHPLAIEDCLLPSDRPKIDGYEDYFFMVIHAVQYSQEKHVFDTVELNMFVGKNFLVTFHRDPIPAVTATLDRVQRNPNMFARAPDRLTYALLDAVLDSYDPAVRSLSSEIVELDQSVLSKPPADLLNQLIHLKSEVQHLRQIAWPQREVIARLAHGEFKVVRAHMLPYYRDLLDRLVNISTQADNYRDSLMNVLQVHLGLQQVQINHVMKVLTVLATLALPMVVVTSFYGMNFVNSMPELQWRYPYPYLWILAVTAAFTGGLYYFLKRRGYG